MKRIKLFTATLLLAAISAEESISFYQLTEILYLCFIRRNQSHINPFFQKTVFTYFIDIVGKLGNVDIIQQSIRPDDILARLEGEVFGLLFTELNSLGKRRPS